MVLFPYNPDVFICQTFSFYKGKTTLLALGISPVFQLLPLFFISIAKVYQKHTKSISNVFQMYL